MPARAFVQFPARTTRKIRSTQCLLQRPSGPARQQSVVGVADGTNWAMVGICGTHTLSAEELGRV